MSQELFQYVTKTVFPRWDRNGEWILQEVEDLNGADGFCRPEEKVICTRLCSS